MEISSLDSIGKKKKIENLTWDIPNNNNNNNNETVIFQEHLSSRLSWIFKWHQSCCFLLCFSITMGQLYDKEKDEDGFLYVAYSGENTFGF